MTMSIGLSDFLADGAGDASFFYAISVIFSFNSSTLKNFYDSSLSLPSSSFSGSTSH
jgi:hypothetical protein